MNPRWLIGLLAVGSCAAPTEQHRPTRVTDAPCVGKVSSDWPANSFLIDREAVNAPLRQQAANGMAAEATIFNTYFERLTTPRGEVQTAVLSAAGASRLNEALQTNQPEIAIYLQAADLPYDGSPPRDYARRRAELDVARLQVLRDYVAAMRPDVVARIHLVGTLAYNGITEEVRAELRQLLSNVEGYLDQASVSGNRITGGVLTVGATTPPVLATVVTVP